MSSRPFLKRFPVIENGSMAGNLTSDVTILQMLTVGTYSYSWSGTSPVGTITVEVSNDYALDPGGDVSNAGTWTEIYFTLNGSSVVNSIPLTGNTGTGFIEFTTGAYAIRTKYTRTSGTGTLNSMIVCKVA